MIDSSEYLPITPTNATINYCDYQDTTINGVTVYTFYVRCNEYHPLPIDANVRRPAESGPYESMRKTLVDEPDMFFFKNGGINVIANDVKIDKLNKKANLDFITGYGILNGGHTQKAIIDTKDIEYIKDNAIVRIEVLEWKNRTNDHLASLAAAKNSSSNVQLTSIANKRGYFDQLKGYMNEKYEKNIQWFENEEIDGDKFTSTKLIAILTLFDLENYSQSTHPTASSNASGSIFKSWIKSCEFNDPKLVKVFPLVNDILNLYEYICSTFNTGIERGFTARKQIRNVQDKGKKTQFSGMSIDFILPEQILIPILASFRADLQEFDGNYRWKVNPTILFDYVKKELFKTVGKFLDKNDINKMSKDTTVWENLYMKVQLGVMDVQQGSNT